MYYILIFYLFLMLFKVYVVQIKEGCKRYMRIEYYILAIIRIDFVKILGSDIKVMF